MTVIGNILSNNRKAKNLTLKELASISGVGPSTISDIETGKAKHPRMDTLEKLANALDVPVSNFFDENIEIDSTTKNKIIDSDIRRIERARSKMKLEDKEKMMKILELSFEEYFDDED